MSEVHTVDRKPLAEQLITIRIEGARWERLREIEKALEEADVPVERMIAILRDLKS